MKCPRCENELKEIDYEGITIDTCEKCHGKWLDHKEIAHIHKMEDETFSEEEKAKVRGFHQPVVKEIQQPETPLLCPRCNLPLRVLNYAYSTGVIIDRCNQCHGIWLDKEEIEHVQIIAEEYRKRMPELHAKFAPILAKIKEETKQRRREHVSSVGYKWIKNPITEPIANAILFHLLD